MKREYKMPSLRVRDFSREVLLEESNTAKAQTALGGYGVSVQRTTVKKVSELQDSKPE